jgi:hypothetical protein
MTVNAPTLSALADGITGTTLTATITPPAAGDYDHTQLLYRVRDAAAWTTGPTYTGAQGVAGTATVTGLTAGQVYEVIAYAVDASSNAGPPSVARRAQPTAGTGSMSERILRDLQAAMEGITVAGGHWATLGRVIRTGTEAPDLSQETLPVGIIGQPLIEKEAGPVMGAVGITDAKLRVTLAIVRNRGTSDTGDDWTAQDAAKMENALAIAVLEDPTRGGLAIDTEPGRVGHNPESDAKFGDAFAMQEYVIHYRHQRDNPSVKRP